MSDLKLLTPVKLGDIELSNRVVMAPLTRMRATDGDVPGSLAPLYYSQRANAGLIITEATQISPLGKGYPATPGIYSKEQTLAWKKVVEAVHEKGGKIVAQLWHVGRISHSSLHQAQGAPIAPSAIAADGKTFTATWGFEPYETPRAMDKTDIQVLLEQFVQAAHNAKEAGFDGVEIHAANGYLLDQFLQSKTNQRVDEYGGSIENRMRLLLEVIEQVKQVFPSSRIGVRLSPFGTFNFIADDDPMHLFTEVLKALSSLNLAYVHLIEPRSTSAGGNDEVLENAPQTSRIFRSAYSGSLISAGGYTRELGEEALQQNLADAIAYGRIYIANPDLVARFAKNAPLNKYNRATFYGGGEEGYTDYPSL